MPDQMTLQQFGATIKKKYPAYASKSDEDVAKAMLEKYPQYADKVQQPKAPPTLLERMKTNFNAATSGPKPGETGVKAQLEKFGQGGGDVIRSLSHPIKTAGQMFESNFGAPEDTGALGLVEEMGGPGVRQVISTAKGLYHEPARTLGQLSTGAIIGEAAEPVITGVARVIPKAARATTETLTGTRPSVVRDLVKDTAEGNQKAIDAAAENNKAAAEKHLEKTQENLHETAGKEATYQAELRKAKAESEDAYQKKLAEVNEKRAKADQERKIDLRKHFEQKSAIQKAQETAATAASRKTASARGVEKIDEPLRADLDKTRENVKKEADQRYNIQRKELNDKQIPFNPAAGTGDVTSENFVSKVTDAWDKSITGSETRPAVIKSIEDRINSVHPLTWRDLQGYRSEIGKKLSSGTLPGDEFYGYKKVIDIIDDGMQKIADRNGMGKQVAADRAFYRQYLETFRDPSSPVTKALNATERGGTLKAFKGADRSGIEAVARYDPALAKRLDFGRDAQAVASAPVRPAPLRSIPKLTPKPELIPNPEPIAPKEIAPPERVAPPNRPMEVPADVKKINIEDIQDAKLKSLQGRANWITHRGAWAATWPVLYALKDILHGNIGGVPGALAEGAATYGAVRGLAGILTRPEVIDFLTKATAKDIAQVPADLRGDLPKIVDAAQKQGIKVSPELAAAVGAATVGQPKGVAKALKPTGSE